MENYFSPYIIRFDIPAKIHFKIKILQLVLHNIQTLKDTFYYKNFVFYFQYLNTYILNLTYLFIY